MSDSPPRGGKFPLRLEQMARPPKKLVSSPGEPLASAAAVVPSRPAATSRAGANAASVARPTGLGLDSEGVRRIAEEDLTKASVRDLPIIVDSMLARNAATGDKVVAQVRSAVALTDEQKSRLAAALAKKTGKQIEVVVDVDPSVLGGIVTQIGDTVIDGSVRQRLSQLRESF